MKNKKFRYSLNSKAFIVGAVIIVLLFNAILISLDSKIPLEFDFTKGKIYELSDETNAIIDQIDEPIEIIFMTQGTEDEDLSLIKNILDKYSQRNSNISVREVNAVKNPVEVQKYIQEYINTYGSALTEGSLLIKQGERYDIVNSADFLNRNQGYSYTEQIVTTKLANFVDGMTLSTVYLTTGHGENLSASTVKILEMGGYTVKSFDTLSEEFPTDNKSVVLICAPRADFSVEEIDKLDKYLEKGGNAQIYFEPLYDDVSTPNLNNYLAGDWGIERQEQRV
ncbi:MAG: Gldg family protein, partial [Clostridia bacterium]|nr:Gldg family protein [Clostridia bacterium]